MAFLINSTSVIDNSRNVAAAAITATGNITAYFSDERLKDFKVKIENATDKVEKINGYYFKANEIAQELGYTDELQIGVNAQEVQAVLPEIVARAPISDNPLAKEEYITVRYEKLVPLLIEAIKEQNKRIKELEAKIG